MVRYSMNLFYSGIFTSVLLLVNGLNIYVSIRNNSNDIIGELVTLIFIPSIAAALLSISIYLARSFLGKVQNLFIYILAGIISLAIIIGLTELGANLLFFYSDDNYIDKLAHAYYGMRGTTSLIAAYSFIGFSFIIYFLSDRAYKRVLYKIPSGLFSFDTLIFVIGAYGIFSSVFLLLHSL